MLDYRWADSVSVSTPVGHLASIDSSIFVVVVVFFCSSNLTIFTPFSSSFSLPSRFLVVTQIQGH